MLWLGLAAFLVYAASLSFGLTELDDSIFINEFRDYNENLHNLLASFGRGLFDAAKDPYYRPLFMDSMILNYLGSDHGQNLRIYHVVNVLLHVASVLLLYKVFIKLNLKTTHAFILCMLFAVHPALSQAVAWIPGRNDTLLAVFMLSFFLYSVNYSNDGKTRDLFLSALFLLLAFFTKETAVFAAPAAFVLLVLVLQKNWLDKKNIIQYIFWAACFVVWYTARASATVQTGITFTQVLHDFTGRLPLIIQYLGKALLPFNLSVFPTQEDTVYHFGIAALVLLGALVFLSKGKNVKVVVAGIILFLLFLLPVLLVPNNLNEQSFEHRLYLPMIGILLLLSQTALFNNKLGDKTILIGGVVVAAIFAGINFTHQDSFNDPKTFWTKAAETSPHSAYANMMLAARIDDNVQESYRLFRKAYQLNPKEKYLNFYYGVMLQKQDSVMQSEKYLLTEKNTSGYFECDFYLARVAAEKRDLNGAITYLTTYLTHQPRNPQANNNLLLLYMDTRQTDKAKAQVRSMRANGVEVPKQISQQLGM